MGAKPPLDLELHHYLYNHITMNDGSYIALKLNLNNAPIHPGLIWHNYILLKSTFTIKTIPKKNMPIIK